MAQWVLDTGRGQLDYRHCEVLPTEAMVYSTSFALCTLFSHSQAPAMCSAHIAAGFELRPCLTCIQAVMTSESTRWGLQHRNSLHIYWPIQCPSLILSPESAGLDSVSDMPFL